MRAHSTCAISRTWRAKFSASIRRRAWARVSARASRSGSARRAPSPLEPAARGEREQLDRLGGDVGAPVVADVGLGRHDDVDARSLRRAAGGASASAPVTAISTGRRPSAIAGSSPRPALPRNLQERREQVGAGGQRRGGRAADRVADAPRARREGRRTPGRGGPRARGRRRARRSPRRREGRAPRRRPAAARRTGSRRSCRSCRRRAAATTAHPSATTANAAARPRRLISPEPAPRRGPEARRAAARGPRCVLRAPAVEREAAAVLARRSRRRSRALSGAAAAGRAPEPGSRAPRSATTMRRRRSRTTRRSTRTGRRAVLEGVGDEVVERLRDAIGVGDHGGGTGAPLEADRLARRLAHGGPALAPPPRRPEARAQQAPAAQPRRAVDRADRGRRARRSRGRAAPARSRDRPVSVRAPVARRERERLQRSPQLVQPAVELLGAARLARRAPRRASRRRASPRAVRCRGHRSRAHGSIRRYPTPQQLMTKRAASGSSFRRSLLACESSVRVRPIDLKPHTSRSSSSLEKTRCGSAARARSRVNSLFASSTRREPDPHLPRRGVYEELADAARALAAWGAAAQHVLDPRRELRVVEGLDDVVVGARDQPPHAVGVRAAPGEHDHREIGVVAAGRAVGPPDLAQDVEPRRVGQAQVEDEQVGLLEVAVAQGVRGALGAAAPGSGRRRGGRREARAWPRRPRRRRRWRALRSRAAR